MVHIWHNKQKSQYCVDLSTGDKTRRVFLGKDKEAAEKKLNEILKRKDAVGGGAINLVDLAENYLDWIKANRTNSTYNIYTRVLSGFIKPRQELMTTDLTAPDLEREKVALKSGGKANDTVNLVIGVVKAMYNWALQMGYIDKNPIAHVKPLQSSPHRERVITPDEETKLLSACNAEFRDIITFFLHTGRRISEVVALKWENIDLKQKTITVPHHKSITTAKNPKPIVFGISVPVMQILFKKRNREGYVFLNGDGLPYKPSQINWRILQAAKKAGVGHVTPHVLRHTVATRLDHNGVPISVISKVLGHSSIQTTMGYIHAKVEDTTTALNTLSLPDKEATGTIIPLGGLNHAG